MDFLEVYSKEVDQGLNIFFDQFKSKKLGVSERTLLKASRYAVTNGGKRIRSVLALLCFELFTDHKVSRAQALKTILSLEFLHTYSLVHDDLPTMDNDTLRRGVPTVWKKYGESTGILVGDMLNSLAFENLAKTSPVFCLQKLVMVLGECSGIEGMIGGQMRDLWFEEKECLPKELLETHRKKTGQLIHASAQFGAILASASEEQLKTLTQYADKIGLAFQIKDDLLDLEGDEASVGKKLGKDIAAKGFIKLFGMETSKKKLSTLIEESVQIADTLKSEKLEQLAIFIQQREK
ncbi:polyprenyl synthetase family protein [Candidatus Gracilibacteria bacterium]|nr:polyprenyl synthetase family protein [Candidatus Gracilibacteria bacterium]